MFDPELLRDLDLCSSVTSFHPPLSVSDPGEGLRLRPLRAGDFRIGFLQLLAQLTSVGEISKEQWQRRSYKTSDCPPSEIFKFTHFQRLDNVAASDQAGLQTSSEDHRHLHGGQLGWLGSGLCPPH